MPAGKAALAADLTVTGDKGPGGGVMDEGSAFGVHFRPNLDAAGEALALAAAGTSATRPSR